MRVHRGGDPLLSGGHPGGLADYSTQPNSIAINVERGQLNEILAPLASDTVTTILGFTEVDRRGDLYNSAAVFQRGSVVGLYRKLHPAINKSIYEAGHEIPVFTVGALTFGILICRDSTYPKLASVMASLGAAALFVPKSGRDGTRVSAAARSRLGRCGN